jgi:hypothetical protein
LEAGADINSKNGPLGPTALEPACYSSARSLFPVAQLLLRAGARVNIRSGRGSLLSVAERRLRYWTRNPEHVKREIVISEIGVLESIMTSLLRHGVHPKDSTEPREEEQLWLASLVQRRRDDILLTKSRKRRKSRVERCQLLGDRGFIALIIYCSRGESY